MSERVSTKQMPGRCCCPKKESAMRGEVSPAEFTTTIGVLWNETMLSWLAYTATKCGSKCGSRTLRNDTFRSEQLARYVERLLAVFVTRAINFVSETCKTPNRRGYRRVSRSGCSSSDDSFRGLRVSSARRDPIM